MSESSLDSELTQLGLKNLPVVVITLSQETIKCMSHLVRTTVDGPDSDSITDMKRKMRELTTELDGARERTLTDVKGMPMQERTGKLCKDLVDALTKKGDEKDLMTLFKKYKEDVYYCWPQAGANYQVEQAAFNSIKVTADDMDRYLTVYSRTRDIIECSRKLEDEMNSHKSEWKAFLNNVEFHKLPAEIHTKMKSLAQVLESSEIDSKAEIFDSMTAALKTQRDTLNPFLTHAPNVLPSQVNRCLQQVAQLCANIQGMPEYWMKVREEAESSSTRFTEFIKTAMGMMTETKIDRAETRVVTEDIIVLHAETLNLRSQH